MVTGTAMIAGGAVLLSAACWSAVRRWVDANRVLRRLELAPTAPGPVPEPIARALTRAGVESDHRVLLQGWFAAVVLAGAASMAVHGGPVLLAAAVIAPPALVVGAQGRAAARRVRQLPLALDAIAAGLRGGASLRAAIADAATVGGPLGRELTVIAAQAGSGRPLADGLAQWAEDWGSPTHPGAAANRLAGAALVVAAELGGPGAAAIDAAAASLRDRSATDDEIAALSVQARLSALLLTLTPVGFAFLLTSLDPTSAHFLLGTGAGWACIAGGLLLDAAGAIWMSRLVRTAR